MTINMQLIAGVILAAIGILALLKIGSFDKFSLDADELPEVIKKSRLWKKEFEFVSKRFGLVSKPDAVFKHNGQAIIGETKTRKTFKVYQSDVIQMSVAKVVVEENGTAVSDVGFVKIATPTGTRWIDKQLMSRDEVLALKNRYDLIKAGQIVPGKCSNKMVCHHCEFFEVC